jgi:GrpB-like predicted nucleotidyltransferase (UPF0157 family)
MMSTKVLREHNPEWALHFESEALRLRRAFGNCLHSIDHIGGTAIADVVTKPIIDILVQVCDFSDIDVVTPLLTAMEYDARGEYGIPGRRYFSKKITSEHVNGYHLHVYRCGTADAVRHLAFRDFLRLHSQVALEYSRLKRSLADASGLLPCNYGDLKSDFVETVERRALLFFTSSRAI